MAASPFAERLRKRSGFLAQVYVTLAAQLAVTAVAVAWLRKHPEVRDRLNNGSLAAWLGWLLLSIALIVAVAFVRPVALKLALFTAFALVLAVALAGGALKFASPQELQAALSGTIAVFVAMTALGLSLAAAGVNLSFLAFALLAALVGLLVAMLVATLVLPGADGLRRALLGLALVLFSVYVAFDTNVLLQKNVAVGFVDAAVNFYLDIVNIFSALMGLSE